MKAFFEIVRLEWRALARSKALALTIAFAVAWELALPFVLHADGTVAGAAELHLRYALGGAFAIVAIALVSASTAAIARERAAKRLQLTMVRPVGLVTVALGKMVALAAAGALALALPLATAAVRTHGAFGRCSHVLKPRMDPPRVEAERMYGDYMADPETPEAVRKAPKGVVLRLLAQRALDRYETIGTNETAVWSFDVPPDAGGDFSVRMRFTNLMELRQDVRGEFTLGRYCGAVSNITQAVVTVPLAGSGTVDPCTPLAFVNRGGSSLMLRPRRDLDLLIPADAFGWNFVRAYLELVSALAALIAFGVFLGSALGRPVAMFTAVVALVVGVISPSVVEQYPDQLESNLADRVGLWITRSAERITHPVASLSPIEALSRGECVERSETAEALVRNALVLPLALAVLAALVMPRKEEGA